MTNMVNKKITEANHGTLDGENCIISGQFGF